MITQRDSEIIESRSVEDLRRFRQKLVHISSARSQELQEEISAVILKRLRAVTDAEWVAEEEDRQRTRTKPVKRLKGARNDRRLYLTGTPALHA